MMVKEGRLVLITRAQARTEMEAAFKNIPPETSLVDQLLEERHQEFLKEEEELRRSFMEPGNVNESN